MVAQMPATSSSAHLIWAKSLSKEMNLVAHSLQLQSENNQDDRFHPYDHHDPSWSD